MPKCNIYITINKINGKIYVGQSLYDNSSYYGSGRLIKNAIKKYGKKNFKKEILEYVSESKLNEREEYWISKLDAINKGYNLSKGGQMLTTKGCKFSKRSKLKMSNSRKNLFPYVYSTPILQYDLDGIFIKEWSSINEIVSKSSKFKTNSITAVCKGDIFHSGGFIWRYKNNVIIKKIPSILELKYPNIYNIPVLQYSKSGELIKEWNSIIEVSKELNYSKKYIVKNCENKSKSSHGFIWKYKR